MDEKQLKRLKADALLSSGVSLKDVAAQLDTPEVTIRSWKKKLEEQNDDLETIVKVDASTLHNVAEKIKSEAPVAIVKKIDKLVDGVIGLQQLEPKFHALTLKLLQRAEELIDNDELSTKDWLAISNGIGGLYSSLFNKSGVNVSVLNQTQVSGEKLQMFKSTMRSS